MKQTVKVLVVDDSALMRKLIPQIIERDSSIQVVGTAIDGEFAMKKMKELRPDVITLDLEMPRMDGLETLRQMMRHEQVPVIVVSAHTTEGATTTLKALGLGAFDFVTKPKDALSAHMSEVADELIKKIKAASMQGHSKARILEPTTMARAPQKSNSSVLATGVIGIGSSTGGPNTLQFLLSRLPADFPAAIVIVQHMPEGFTSLFAKRLDECSAIHVKEAQSGDLLLAGRALICPGNRHIKVRRMPAANIAMLTDEPKVNGHRPSVDVMFRSLAAELGSSSLGVLMTGMGDDGAEGLGEMKRNGAMTIAQDEESSVIYGMPRAAVERGYAMRIVSLDALPNALMAHFRAEEAP